VSRSAKSTVLSIGRQWCQLHIRIDAQTLQIRTICVTSNNASDAALVPDLLQQFPTDEVLESLISNIK
jgi:hypothetical protein